MLIEWFLSIKSLANLLFGVLCLPGDQSHPFAQPTINPLACCICWAGLLGCAVFPPWNEGPNFGSYKRGNSEASPMAQWVKKPPAKKKKKKETTCKEDTGHIISIPGSGSSPGGENGNPLQYSCLKNSMDRGA